MKFGIKNNGPEKIETQPPATAGTTKEEAQKMDTLTEFLAANPAAKAEHDAIVLKAEGTARVEGETAGKEEMLPVPLHPN